MNGRIITTLQALRKAIKQIEEKYPEADEKYTTVSFDAQAIKKNTLGFQTHSKLE